MADINQQLTAHLGLNTTKFRRGLVQANREAKAGGRDMARSFAAVATRAAAVGAAVTAAAAAMGKLAERGGKVTNVQRGFDRVTGNSLAGIQRLRAATNGLVTDYDLMVQANTAFTLGSAKSVAAMERMFDVGQRLGRTLGLDTLFAVNSLNTGIARQSRLLLDNLGIIVDVDQANRRYAQSLGKNVRELTEFDKKQAFANEAMRKAEEAADRLGSKVLTAGDAWRQFNVEFQNTIDHFASDTSGSGRIRIFFEGLADALKAVRDNGRGAFGAIDKLSAALFGDQRALDRASPPGGGQIPTLPGLTVTARGPLRRPAAPLLDPFGNALFTPESRRAVAGGFGRRFVPGQGLTGLDQFGPFTPQLPGGFSLPGVGATIGERGDIRTRMKGLADAEAMRKLAEETQRWQETILSVANTIERRLVRSLSRAIMQFESIGSLIRDIAKSLLEGVITGLVGFGVGALKSAALGAFGIDAASTIGPAGFSALGTAAIVQAPGGATFNISSDTIPEPTDYGIIASKAQVQRLVVATIKAARANGADV